MQTVNKISDGESWVGAGASAAAARRRLLPAGFEGRNAVLIALFGLCLRCERVSADEQAAANAPASTPGKKDGCEDERGPRAGRMLRQTGLNW